MEKNLITPLLSAPCSFTEPLPVLLLSIRELKAIYLFTIKGEPSPPFFLFMRGNKARPIPGKGEWGPTSTCSRGARKLPARRSFFFCKADLLC